MYTDTLDLGQNNKLEGSELQQLRALATEMDLHRLAMVCTFWTSQWNSTHKPPTSLIPGSTFIQDMEKAYLQNGYADVMIIGKDNLTLRASSFILSSRCCYFSALFESSMKESNTKTIELKEAPIEALNILIHFLYTGVLRFDPYYCCEVWKLGQYFVLPEAQSQCEELIQKSLSPQNALIIASQAHVHGLDKLSNIVLTYIQEHIIPVMQNQEFLNLVKILFFCRFFIILKSFFG